MKPYAKSISIPERNHACVAIEYHLLCVNINKTVNIVHALVCHEYEFPAPKLKPCLLLLLDEGYPGDLPDMHGRTPADYAKKYGHTAMRGVLTALVKKTKQGVKNSTTNNKNSGKIITKDLCGKQEARRYIETWKHLIKQNRIKSSVYELFETDLLRLGLIAVDLNA